MLTRRSLFGRLAAAVGAPLATLIPPPKPEWRACVWWLDPPKSLKPSFDPAALTQKLTTEEVLALVRDFDSRVREEVWTEWERYLYGDA